MTLSTGPMLAAACVLGGLGALHLLYTWRGRRLHPRDPSLRAAMERSSLVITRQTTVWRAHQGFNVSHGLGMVGLALVYGELLWRQPGVMAASPLLAGLGMALWLSYLVLARHYFFSVPFRAMALACALYAAGWALA